MSDNDKTIRTYTGRCIAAWDPQPGDIDPIDIAVGLARAPRWAGQSRQSLSVARHSINVGRGMSVSWLSWHESKRPESPERAQLLGLLHDGAEAYLGDLASPFKEECGDYRRLEFVWMTAIAHRFGLSVAKFDYPMLHDIDRSQRGREAENVFAETYPQPILAWQVDAFDWLAALLPLL